MTPPVLFTSIIDPMALDARIRAWFSSTNRELPWRSNRTAYRVWVSEIMLQQTQVVKVIDYFQRFMLRFPDVSDLAQASEDEVLSLWSGLGYYSRARNLHAAAKIIIDSHNGRFPEDLADISALPGIGSYTSGAVLAFAYNQAAAVVDGNVSRVLSRLYADDTDFSTHKGRKHFEALSLCLAQESKCPRDLQEGLMELGALVCRPRSPSCEICPISELCCAFLAGTKEKFPVKPPKVNKKEIHGVFAVIGDEKHIWLDRENGGNLFKGLYAPPHVVVDEEKKCDSAFSNLLVELGIELGDKAAEKILVTRVLTHRVFHMHALAIKLDIAKHPKANWVRRDQMNALGISAATAALIDKTKHVFE